MQTNIIFSYKHLLGIVCLCLVFAPFVHAETAATKPNFIIIIGDDVGWNDIGAYGNPSIRTPNIDAIAKAGLKFNNAFLTTSSCSPSRASIMTSRYPHSTGAGELHQPLAETAVTIPVLLKDAGYYTACAGKFHMGYIKSHFDLVVNSQPSGCETWVEVLQNRPKEKPFFLWFAGNDAHRGWSATEGDHAIEKPHENGEIVVPPYLPDTPVVRRDLAQYYDEVSRLDAYTGRVMDELETQGVLENTIVIFMSDNGRPFPRAKTTLHDSGLKTPFVVQWKNHIPAGTTTDSLISAVDIAPSILELAGVKEAETFQGQSFVGLFSDPKTHVRDYAFGEHNWHDYQAHERSVRSLDYLYIKNSFPQFPATPPADAVNSMTYGKMKRLLKQGKLSSEQAQIFRKPQPEESLFDLTNDPYSFNNLIANPDYKKILVNMRNQHQNWVNETNDFVPENPSPDTFHRDTGDRL